MNKEMNHKLPLVVLAIVLAVSTTFAKVPQDQGSTGVAPDENASSLTGSTTTLLPDGRALIVGGQSDTGRVQATLSVKDPTTGFVSPISSRLRFARAWHSATVLPDGTVLILGGIGAGGKVATIAELFDPASETVQTLASIAPTPRVFHTATLLTDGRLLVAGGVSASGAALRTIELWDSRKRTVSSSATLSVARRNHSATLLPDGRVFLAGGKDDSGNALSAADLYDPESQGVSAVEDPKLFLATNSGIAEVRATSPEDGATDVPVDALISMRFSRSLLMRTINGQTIVLKGPEGTVQAKIIGAEGGGLAFITPSALVPGTNYTVVFSGATDTSNAGVAFSQFTFTTAGEAPQSDTWDPTSDWQMHGSASKWQTLPPLQAAPGVTGLAGQVLKLDGTPLPSVRLEIGDRKAWTDKSGRFLITHITAGHHPMRILGSTANTNSRVYGIYEVGVDIKARETNVLKYTIWMTPLDMAHAVTIPSPTVAETVIQTPLLPGLELHIPADTVITGYDGKVVTKVSITPIPLDRPPFPLPTGVPVPLYFTIQPGSSYIKVMKSGGPRGARLFYPNTNNYAPGTQFSFWNYDPDHRGWFIYGLGRVSSNRSQVIPNPGVSIYEFTGAMVAQPGTSAANTPIPGPDDGEPVNLPTGIFVYTKTDLALQDVIPMTLTRTYRPGDLISRAFGIGTSHPYDIFLVGPNNTTPGGGYTYIDLILADGTRLHFPRISPCTGANGYCDFRDGVFQHTSTPTSFYGATITWNTILNNLTWTLTKKDGTVYIFPDSDGSSISQAAAPIAMHDRYGNALFFKRDTNSNLTQLTTPNGRWIQFTYDGQNRVTQAQDSTGRIVRYFYDAGGRLAQVTDANGGNWYYTYDAFSEMLTIQDPRGIVYLTNQYDTSGRVILQTQADNSTFQFSYTTDPITNNITQTDVTDPRGNVTRTTFNSNEYTTSQILGLNKPEQQTFTFTEDPNTNLITSVVNPLSHETDYTYDAMGNTLTMTRLAKTSSAATTTFTYDPIFNQVTSVQDPLQHVTSMSYNPDGSLKSVQDALGNKTAFANNSAGQIVSVTDAMQHPPVQFTYSGGDLVAIMDQLNNITTRFVDGAGRVAAITNALNQSTRFQYNVLNQVTQITDALGGTTSFTYDGNGNLLTLQDPRGGVTGYTYDNRDRVIVRTDPLLRSERFSYDVNGNLVQKTDRRGKITTLTYDALDRTSFAGFGTVIGNPNTYESTINYSYDGLNRPLQLSDSLAGTTGFSYDDLNRKVTETTTLASNATLGTVAWTYDAAGRRTGLAVSGQSAISYTYDADNRPYTIAQGSSSVQYTFDNDSRRSALVLPNGVTVSYGYDSANRLTTTSYQMGGNSLGTLSYSYDPAGRRTQMTGSLARTSLPQPVTSAAYDAGNELLQWGSSLFSYDAGGNTVGDGANTYTWNARNQLTSFNALTFQYDGLGRRRKNGAGTQFLYDGANAVQELSGTTPTANLLTGGIDEFFSRTDSAAFTPLTDGLGSVLALTDSTGTVGTQYTYDPFGNTTSYGGTSTNVFQYTGRENDGNGLYFYRARYSSPTFGRFINEDPIGLAGGINQYAYTSDSPTNLIDPFGLLGCEYQIDCVRSPEEQATIQREHDAYMMGLELPGVPTPSIDMSPVSIIPPMAGRNCGCEGSAPRTSEPFTADRQLEAIAGAWHIAEAVEITGVGVGVGISGVVGGAVLCVSTGAETFGGGCVLGAEIALAGAWGGYYITRTGAGELAEVYNAWKRRPKCK